MYYIIISLNKLRILNILQIIICLYFGFKFPWKIQIVIHIVRSILYSYISYLIYIVD